MYGFAYRLSNEIRGAETGDVTESEKVQTKTGPSGPETPVEGRVK